MLEMKHKHDFHLPHFELPRQMELSPVPIANNDELTRAIDNDPVEHDDVWELDERPDTGELTDYWQSVEDDIRKDPEWFTFSDS
jgi:hypothetical protein